MVNSQEPTRKNCFPWPFTFSSSQNPTLFCIQYFNGARYCLIRTQCVLYLHHVIFINDQVDFERLALVSVWCSPVDDVLCSLPFHTLRLSFYCCLTLFTVNNSQMKKAMISLLKNIKYQPSCLALDQAWPLQLLFQDMFSESEPEQVSTKCKKAPGHLTAWAAIAHDKHLDHHNFLITTALIWWSLIHLPNARGVWLHCDCYLLQLWEHLFMAERIFKDI